jgi:glycosyltransferase A (GT-A) superfamily protein (DUF2064 family)
MNQPCLVLMFKAPAHSKRRLAREIGAPAEDLAVRLLACVGADLARWPGEVRYAAATQCDADWLAQSDLPPHRCIVQPEGNLGVRINGVNAALAAEGLARQIYIGIDCPALTPADLEAAAAALATRDVALAPARDGGVVLMGVNGLWPDLEPLPWSEPVLCESLLAACRAAGLDIAVLPTRDDIDSLDDLLRVGARLRGDARPTRRALCEWIDSVATGAQSVPR